MQHSLQALIQGDGTPAARWLALMLDEVDYAMLLLDGDLRVVHLNHVARTELDAAHPLQLSNDAVCARRQEDAASLRHALQASVQGKRCLLTLGLESQRIMVAVVPLMPAEGSPATLLVFGKRAVCQELSAQWFARHHGLTLAETQVLEALCSGARPSDVAAIKGVALSTVRSHISSLRAKTGAPSIREVVRQVAVLPPLVSALKVLPH